MYTPNFQEFESQTKSANLIPVYRTISADLETPVSAYLKTARGPYSFLLESVEGGEQVARFSFIGAEPSEVIRTGPGEPDGAVDPLDLLRTRMTKFRYGRVPGLPSLFHGGAVGFLSYDAVRHFEPRVPQLKGASVGTPESVFMRTDGLLVFDHVKHSISVVTHAEVNGNARRAYDGAVERVEALVERLDGPLPDRARRRPDPRRIEVVSPLGAADYGAAPRSRASGFESAKPNMSRATYERMIEAGKRAIFEGEVIQVVLSQRLERPTFVGPFDVYRSLRAVNPSPYMFYLELDGFQIIGASPELLVKAVDGQVAVHPIAGTRPRGATPEDDARLEKELRTDEKERAEHVMLLDLGRNDVGRVSLPGSVKVEQRMDVERYSHVMHLVSHVTGKLRPEFDAYDALRAGFPAGTVSGAPKVRAMELIAEMEPDKRGPYAGGVGFFSYTGNMETAIAIRTIVMKDGVAHMQAGGGVVADSTPEGEYQESLHKMRAPLRAIEEAEAAAGR
ncbi:MAG: anthranilate synthase component I [Chloroflexi bacterium]|nr:anthranilate synthase component I [Chloroflexota bacterium]